jgi:hypothetical protein
MKLSQIALAALAAASCGTMLWSLQRTADFGFGNDDSPSNVKSEFYWSRLAYNSNMQNLGGFGGFGRRGWASWSRDYPKADRQFLIAMHRLTRIDGRPYEQVVTLDNDDIFNYPWVYAVQVQNWSFSDAQAKRLREYLLKGGFLMVDDFHGTDDWEHFMEGMRQVLPDRPVEDLQSGDEIFHTLYDIDDKMQIPGEQYVWSGRTYERDGYQPKWRAIRDEKGRIIVAICHNMHLGDAWEWADAGDYPEKFSGLAFRIVLNYITYAMTH